MVVQAGAFEVFVIEVKTQWFHQMKLGTSNRGSANGIASIGGNDRIIEHDV